MTDAYDGFANEPEDEQAGTGIAPVITDGAITDQADEPDGEGLRQSVNRELSERADDEQATDDEDRATAHRINTMRDDDERTFRGYR
jgi:hypothetical protein